MDAKVGISVGEFDRGGKTRLTTVAQDHDFNRECRITPYGIFVPKLNQLNLFFVSSKLTADCIVDLLEMWWSKVKGSFSHIKKLVINQDNGPENHSRRTQFMKRIVDFAHQSGLDIQRRVLSTISQ